MEGKALYLSLALLAASPSATMAQAITPASCHCVPNCDCAPGCAPSQPSYTDGTPWVTPYPSDSGTTTGPSPTPGASSPAPTPNAGAPPVAAPDFGAPADAPLPSLSPNLGAVAQSRSAAPGMIGDYFNSSLTFADDMLTEAFGAANGTIAVGAGDRIFKFSENIAAMPQDRVYFTYNLFTNAVNRVGDSQAIATDLSRYTFGFEKTFFDGLSSLELRAPFLSGAASSQTQGSNNEGGQFGNLSLVAKLLVWEERTCSVAAGLGMIFPTGDDATYFNSSDELQIEIENTAFYLQPFIGFYHQPSDRLFQQFFVQMNFDTSGYDFFVPSDSALGGGLGASASDPDLTDNISNQTLLFLDYSVGYWMYKAPNCGCCRPACGLTGIAPIFELHYTTSVDEQESGTTFGPILSADRHRDILNATGALLFRFGERTNLRVAGVAPLRSGTDKLFDGEFSMQLVQTY